MKKLLILLFSLLVSVNSYGDWTRVTSNELGDVAYVDLQTVKIVSNMRYFYYLKDYVSPSPWGDLSNTSYRQINCKTFQAKDLLLNYYAEPLGKGSPTEGSGPTPDSKWQSYPLDSMGYAVSEYICNLKM